MSQNDNISSNGYHPASAMHPPAGYSSNDDGEAAATFACAEGEFFIEPENEREGDDVDQDDGNEDSDAKTEDASATDDDQIDEDVIDEEAMIERHAR